MGFFPPGQPALAPVTIIGEDPAGEVARTPCGTTGLALLAATSQAAAQTIIGGGGGSSAISSVSVTGTTTLTSSVFGQYVVCSGTSANYPVTLPTAVGNAGQFIGFRMASGLSKLVTLTGASAQTIDGSNTRVMWAGETATLISDGSNWYKISGKSIPMICQMRLNATQTGVVTATVTPVLLNATDVDNTGLMASISSSDITIQRPSRYLYAAGTPLSNASASFSRFLCLINQNGTVIDGGEVAVVSGSFPSPEKTGVCTAAAGDVFALSVYHNAGSNQMLTGESPGDSCTLTLSEVPQW